MKAAPIDAGRVIEEAPLTVKIVDAMRRVSRTEVRDLRDRLGAATGIYFGVPIISRDVRILSAILRTAR